MGFGEKIKDIYFSGEEKWYSLLDKIDSSVPIYKVIDKIDEIVPSFALFLILILIIVLLFGVGFLGGFTVQETTLRLSVVNNSGNYISNAKVTIEGIDEIYYTNDFGTISDVILPRGYTVSVTAEKDGKKRTEPVLLNFEEISKELKLPVDSISFSSKTLMFLSSTSGTLITDELTLNYSCSDGENPTREVIYDGTANVNVPINCGVLSLTITSSVYETKTTTITNASTQITLNELAPSEMGSIYVTLKYEGEVISEDIEVMAFKADYAYFPEDTVTSENGIATMQLVEGNYIFKTKQQLGYKQAVSEVVSVDGSGKNITLNLEKSILGEIKVRVRKGNSIAEDVLVTLRKGSSEMDNDTTDTNGYVVFEVAENGPFTVIATEDGYCEKASVANIGDDIELRLTLDTGSCGGELKVKVIDQDGKPVQYAKAILFGEKDEDTYKLSYNYKITNYDGNASWNPLKYSEANEKYKIFAYKGDYSGWSSSFEFTSITSSGEIIVTLDIPIGQVKVNVKDKYNEIINFAEVQLFEDYGNNPVTGKKIIEGSEGITFLVKAGQRVYAVVGKDGYESYMTLPTTVKGNGTINFDVVLNKPPYEELKVEPKGLYKDGKLVLRAQPGEEYLAVYEITAPKNYEELGFFLRTGKDSVTKTEQDKLFIKELIAPGIKVYGNDGFDEETGYGSSYNPPNGYSIDNEYRNLEESKWAQTVWAENGYVKGKIRVGAIIRIKESAKQNEQLEIGYRVWAVDGDYERDPVDQMLGSSASNSNKNMLYALTKPQYIWIGTESLCETQGENSFCITSTVTDEDDLTYSFDTSFDAQNNSTYNLAIKIYNASNKNFDVSRIKLENSENNLFLGNYVLMTPLGAIKSAQINDYETEWIDTGEYKSQTEMSFNSLEVTPQKTGYAPLLLRIRDASTILFEKVFNINVSSDKELKAEYLFDNKYQTEMPKLISGKLQNLTIRVKNKTNDLEVNGAKIKLYDRFNDKLYEKETNSIGITTIEIPASLPGEKLRLSIEKNGYATLDVDFKISEDVVTVTPETLSFTVNPQTKSEDTQIVKIENKTGLDLTIKEIIFNGKTKGLLSSSQMESWFDSYKGLVIKSNDYEEIEFKVISANLIPAADDIEGKFQIIVGNTHKEWVSEIDTKIRVGLGKDVDSADCLELTLNNWTADTQGEEIQVAFELKNNCMAEGIPVKLRNLGGRVDPSGNLVGGFSVTTTGAYSALSRGYTRTFATTINGGEVIPITLRFTPFGGTSGKTEGTIAFEAINKTDSTNQILNTSLDYSINIIDSSCLVIGADLVQVPEEGTASFNITNNCPTSASFGIESELSLDNKVFTLASNESKDVTITRNEGDLPGAYNNLVSARIGNNKMELIGNVKAILDAGDSCFSLSRYEFDVYDSPYNEMDGSDRGYVRNECTQKVVSAEVSGEKEFDWDKVMRDMLVGGIAGLVMNDFDVFPDWLDNIFKREDSGTQASLSQKNNEAAVAMTQKLNLDFAAASAEINNYSKNLEDFVANEEKEANKVYQDLYSEINATGNKTQACALSLTSYEKINVTYINTIKQNLTTVQKETKEISDEFNKKIQNLKQEITKLETDEANEIKLNKTSLTNVHKKYTNLRKKLVQDYNASTEEINTRLVKLTDDFYIKRTKEIEKVKTAYNKCITDCSYVPTESSSAPFTNKFVNDYKEAFPEGSSTITFTEYGEMNATHLYNSTTKNEEIWLEGTKGYTVYKFINEGKTIKEYTTDLQFKNSTAEKDTLKTQISNEGYDIELLSKEEASKRGLNTRLNFRIISPSKYLSPKDTEIATTIAGQYSIVNSENKYYLSNGSKLFGGLYTQEAINSFLEKYDGKKYIVIKDQKGVDDPTTFYKIFNPDGTQNGSGGYLEKQAAENQANILNDSDNWNEDGTWKTANFLLASNFGMNDMLGYQLINVMAGGFGGSALGGALLTGALSILQGQELGVQYSDSFTTALVTITGISLQSEGGVSLSVGETTYDYDDYYQSLSAGGSTTSPTANQNYSTSETGYTYNPSAMNASIGLVEVRELIFTGGGEVTDTPYTPFTGILTVTGEENVFETDYDYEYIQKQAKARGSLGKEKNWFEEIINPSEEETASMTVDDLVVKETRLYEKKFHLLFDSFEYVECGPKTYPCQGKQINNCKVGNKTGVTGNTAVPKILLDWSWSGIDLDACDESNNNYVYCDTTQAVVSTLKKVYDLKEFFNTNELSKCPSTIDIAGTKTQDLSTNSIDVAITSIALSETDSDVTITTMVETNNNQELLTGIIYTLTRNDDSVVANNCDTTKQALTSYKEFTCTLNKSAIGTGSFKLNATLDLELCSGCENTITSNDAIETTMILGQDGVQNCEEYSTRSRNYFEKVLSANGILNNSDAQKAINSVSFTMNLVKDGFSEDYRSDLDNYLMQFTSAPQEYTSELRELFLKKFVVKAPTTRNAWEAGKFKARLIIDFANDSWEWNDANDIELITLELEPWAEPDIDHAIYDVAFNGMVGINTDNGRNGYGVNFVQTSEEPILIIEGSGENQTVRTETDPSSNALTEVNVAFDDSFYNMNSWSSGTRGNVLTIGRSGDKISMTMSPSIAVPTILNITRNQSLDAYAFYSVEIDGQAQNVGPSMITWTGIGQGCVDFSGSGMGTWDESFDTINESGDGYGLRWNNTIAKGTASFYGVFYVPEDSLSSFVINEAMESANVETTFGNGTRVVIDSGNGINSIKEVLDGVANGEICVSGGHYFWNNKQIIEALNSSIQSKEQSCITIS